MRWAIPLILITSFNVSASVTDKDQDNWAVENRLFVGEETSVGIVASKQIFGLDWHLGGYVPLDNRIDFDSSFDYGVAKHFEINKTLGFSLGLGALDDHMYTDYQLNARVNRIITLQTGYRFHLDDDFINQNEIYLGMRFELGEQNEIVPPPEPAPTKPNAPQYLPVYYNDTFYFDSSEYKVSYTSGLEVLADKVKDAREIEVNVTGYADSSGVRSKNQILSKRRAQSVADVLVGSGIDVESITIEGRGIQSPAASNDTPEGRAKNRRVDVQVRGKIESSSELETK